MLKNLCLENICAWRNYLLWKLQWTGCAFWDCWHNLGFSGGQSDKPNSKAGVAEREWAANTAFLQKLSLESAFMFGLLVQRKELSFPLKCHCKPFLPCWHTHTHKSTPKIQKNTHAQVICWALARDRIPGTSFRLQLLLQHSIKIYLLKYIKNTVIVLTTLPSATVWPRSQCTLSYTGKIGKECLERKKCKQLIYWQRNKHKYSEFYCH